MTTLRILAQRATLLLAASAGGALIVVDGAKRWVG